MGNVLTALFAAAALATAPLGGAAELVIDPAVCSKADGVYEISVTSPESFYFYSPPFDVVPGGLYRYSMNACWFGEKKGSFAAGVEDLTTDYDPAGSQEPNILCARMTRIGDNSREARLAIGRWQSTRTIRFTEPTLVPAVPIYKMILEKGGGRFLALGTGESIEGARYTFQMFADQNDGNFARALDFADVKFNTNRWCFRGGQSIVYRFDLRPKPLGGSAPSAESVRFVSAEATVDSHYFAAGRCLLEMSADGQNWHHIGTLEKAGAAAGTAEELFASPVETLYIRCRADDAEPETYFEINGLTLSATLDTDGYSGYGETICAECTEAAPGADNRFEVTPLYFDKETIFCRVTNKTDGALSWPGFSYTLETAESEAAECRAGVDRTDAAEDASLAAGESALFAVDLSNHPAGKGWVEKTCRFDKTYRIIQKIPSCFVQDYTRALNVGGALDLSWCEADRKVPRSPWNITMKQPAPIAIAAPRNDFEGFQIVVRPKEDLSALTAESSDLAGPGGALVSRENIKIRWGYYHRVDTPSDETCARGWYVDALVPITVGRSGEIGDPLTVAAGQNQPIFITVYVPLGTPKGEYTGEVTLRAQTAQGAGQTLVRLPYKLTVWDFDQPVKNRFETAYGFASWDAFAYQNVTEEPDRRTVWEKYLKDASDHRISFYDPAPLDNFRVTFDKENLKANFDFAAFDAEMTRVMDKYNVSTFIVPVQGIGGGNFEGHPAGELAGFSADTPEYDALMADYLGKLQEHLREKGWLSKAYIYWYDEPEEKDYEFVASGFGQLKKYAPDLAGMLTEEPSDRFCEALREAGGNVDIWCPISDRFSSDEAQKRLAKGERFWWYVCCDPKAPYCTEFADHPAHELRLWHWQAFQRGITGSLIWTTNYWNSIAAYPDGHQDPYVDPMSYQVGYGAAPGEKLPWGNGEGRYFYPPLSAATPGRHGAAAIIEDPVDSIRLEELREGIEDYEILLTLRQRYEKKKAVVSQEEREEIEKIFDFSDITTDMTHFTDDPAVILAHRARAAEAIQRLGE